MRKKFFLLALVSFFLFLCPTPSHAQLTTWDVRNTTGDYDEQVLYGYASCYEYPMQYTGTWRGYVECPGSGCYAGFAVNTLQNLGKICYRSRVDANSNLRGGFGFYGSGVQEYARLCRRNYQVAFENQPSSPVGFEFYYTKEEIDYLISSFNATYGTSKSYSDLIIVKYNGPNQDLDPANNSSVSGDYQKIIPSLLFFGSTGQYAYAEFNVSSYSEFYLALTTPHANIYVNDNSTSNDVYTTAVGNNANAGTITAPVATVTHALSIAQAGDTIVVDAGIYTERLFVNKAVYFKGAYSGVNPGTSLNRGLSESILLPSTENNTLEIITIQVSGISFDGFLFDGDNPAISGTVTLNGTDVNAGMAMNNANLQTNNLVVKNNIFRNFLRYGILLQKTTSALTGIRISQNHIDNISSRSPRDGRAVGLFNNAYATVTNNHLTRVNTGVIMANFNISSFDSVLIASNTIEAYSVGVSSSNHNNLISSITVYNNQISVADLVAWNAPGSSTVNTCAGISMGAIGSTNNLSLISNNISGTRNGIGISQFNSTGRLSLVNNIVASTFTGVQLSSINTPPTVTVSGGSISGSSQIGLFYIGNGTATDKISVNDLSLVNNVVGMDVSAVGGNLQMEFSGVTINGGITGIRFYGTQLSLPGNTLSGVSFSNQSQEYILQTSHSFEGQTIDASTVSFDGITPASMTLAQLFATEDKLTHKIDFDSVGYFRLRANEVFVTPNSFAATLPPVFGVPTTTPDINRAVRSADPGNIIHIAAGVYANQVTLDKGVSLIGEGQNVTSIILPATPAVPPPGPFTEIGVIQTAQNIGDVHISNLSVTGNPGITPIIIQSGGSVQNCAVQNGNQGIFFRAETGIKTVTIENNLINAEYIGVNTQGPGMTTSLLNNTITVANQDFSAGVFAGLDFGPLVQLTVTNNNISNFKNYGLFANSFNSNYSNNSIVSSSGNLIEQFSGNPSIATCNWFGTTDASLIASRISGAVNYSPWLTDGTDTDPAPGFQPAPGTCNGRQNKFYVNDNNTTGDVFTTAVGNNGNTGLASQPFATITHAISVAQATDTIIVDAGTFIENVVVNKSLTLRGVKYGQQPGASLDRGGETIVMPAVNNTALNSSVIKVIAHNTTIDGFTLDGDNPALPGGLLVNGVDANAGSGVFNDNQYINNLTVINNIVKNTAAYGIGQAKNASAPAANGALFRYNRVDNVQSRGLVLNFNSYGSIMDNYVTRSNNNGIWVANSTLANPGGLPVVVSGNTVRTTNLAIQVSVVNMAAPRVEILNNDIIGGSAGYGISILGGPTGGSSGVTATNNKIAGYLSSVLVNLSNAVSPVTFNNNSFSGYASLSLETYNGLSINAACNWHGVNSSAAVASKVLGNVNYIPWLVSGTDADPAIGFQPGIGSCTGTPVIVTVTTSTNINCNGNANGSIDITTSGGTTPYLFAWVKDSVAGFSNLEDLSNLAPGVYQLSVIDANGSTDTTTEIGITEPLVLEASTSGSHVSCFGYSDGSASVVATGGTAPYTYLWSNTATTSSINGLLAGNYSVTVTDAHGCNILVSYTVTQPVALSVTMTGTGASCNGSATATPAGGTSPYTYNWSNGGTTQTISAVPNGTYTVTVTDAQNCMVNGTYTITGNSPINPNATAVNVSCYGGSDGSITVSGAGGIAPLTYNINGGTYQASNIFSNLPAGIYVAGARDATGCIDFVTRTITQPTVLTATLDSVKAACFGTNTGRIWTTATGGTGSKTYSWTGPNGFVSTTQDPSNLLAGLYTLTITDANNCTAIIQANVVGLPQISIAEVITQVDCRGNLTGAINVTVTGGSGTGFIYSWTGPNAFAASSEDITGRSAGNYTLAVTDIANGCTFVKVIIITQPAAILSLVTARTNVNGCISLGTITATASGGTSPYQYSVDSINYQSSGLLINLAGGTYTVYAKDLNGCIATKVVIITDNGSDQYEGNNSKNQAKTINTGSVISARIALAADVADWFKFTTPAGNSGYTLTLTHPSATFVFNLYMAANNSPALVPVSSTATTKEYNLTGNTIYYISVTGGLSYTCYDLSVTPPSLITKTTSVTTSETGTNINTLHARVYPNPHQGNFNLIIESPEEGIAVVELFNSRGEKISARTVSLVKGNNNVVTFSGINNGTIFYRVVSGKQITTGKVIGSN